MSENNIPKGWKENALGHLVRITEIRESDLMRDASVTDIAQSALVIETTLREFKQQTLQEIAELIQISAEKYGVTMGGKEGNVVLHSYDGRYRVERSKAKTISFTEELQAAKKLIDECITEWADGADQKLLAVINRAFKPNQNGEMKTASVLDLLRLDIDDANWVRAMTALKDSIQTTGATTYVRIYERVGDTDKYRHISLNITGV